ncbi:GDSL esterase/lipase [Tanacetum coccineum]
MASPREIFDESGPLHLLTSFDWRNTFHRRSLAASLVQGVYILERDRQRGSVGAEAHASPWWERFHFQLNHLEESSRFRTAFEAVSSTVSNVGPMNVWLAGHSLGASIALLAGRNMAKSWLQLETYLFNPPFFSFPIEKMIKNETIRHGVRIVGSLMTAGIASVMKLKRDDHEEDPFIVLSEWTPYMFVNPSDPICAEYIGYFQHRERMEDIGKEKIARIATRHSIGSLISGAMGRDSEAFHILPTAYVTVNLNPSDDFKKAHGIHQKKTVVAATVYLIWQENFSECAENLDGITLQRQILVSFINYGEEALVLFDNMSGRYIRPDTITFNVIIDGYGKIGDMSSVLDLYDKMLESGSHPDVITFTSVLDGYCRVGELHEGLKIWDEMNRRNLYPNIYTFSILIITLCKEGRFTDARDLLRQLNQIRQCG